MKPKRTCVTCKLPFKRERAYWRPECEDCERGQIALFELPDEEAPATPGEALAAMGDA